MKKRLLKDLPFDNLKKGDVLCRVNGSYQIELGETFYSSGRSSHNGVIVLDSLSQEIVDMIWDNNNWFEDAVLNHITVIPKASEVILKFDSICLDDSICLAKGIIHILPHLTDNSFVWNKFKDITTSISHR
jgi:hypothetical protein